MTLREELIDKIRRLPEEKLWRIAAHVDEVEQEAAAPSWDEIVAHARAFRARMKQRYGTMPDSVELLRQAREERLNDLMGLH